MVRFQDFEVIVRVQGQALPEYENEDEAPSPASSSVTRYIEAQSGAKFGIDMQYVGGTRLPGPPSIMGMSYDVYVDGVCVRRKTPRIPPYRIAVEQRTRRKGTKRYESDLIFSELNIVEELDPHDSSMQAHGLQNRIQDVGTIEVQMTRVTDIRSMPDIDESLYSSSRHDDPFDGSNKVSEKALKGDPKSLFVKFGSERAYQSKYVSCTYYDKRPFVTFKFKYRSRRALEQLHIVPRSPPPQQNGITGLNREELLALVESQQSQIQAPPNRDIKPEPSASFVGSMKRAHEEEEDDEVFATETRRVRPRGSNSNGYTNTEIVDLTDD